MKKTMLTSAAAGLALAAGAWADPPTDSVVQTWNFGFELSPGGDSMDFAQFDTSTGNPNVTRELQKVIITIDVTIGASITAENDNVEPAEFFGVNLTGLATLDFGTLGASAAIIENETAPGGVAGSDGNPGSGPDFYDFGFVSGSDNDMDMTSDAATLAQFIGNGMMTATIAGSGGFAVSGASNSTINVTDFGASGTVTIEYLYKLVPTPGSAALIGLAGVVAVGRRRR